MKIRYDWRAGVRALIVFGSTVLFGAGIWQGWQYQIDGRQGSWMFILVVPSLLLGLAVNIALAFYVTAKKERDEKD